MCQSSVKTLWCRSTPWGLYPGTLTGAVLQPILVSTCSWCGWSFSPPFTALGFWIGLHEAKIRPQRHGTQMALTLIGLLPFFLYTLLMAAIGSLSGMIGGLQGLLILWLVLAFGNLLQVVGHRPWLTAVCMAVLLYWLILPQGVLF